MSELTPALPRWAAAALLVLAATPAAGNVWAQEPDVAPPSTTTPPAVGGPRLSAVTVGIQPAYDDSSAADTGAARPRAVEYSEGYAKRLAIHRVASYAEFPLFVTEYILGEKLLNDERNTGQAPGGLKTAHGIVAGGLGVLFLTNTVTGVWNLWEARHDPAGRTRRTIHGVGMLLADAGFVATAALAQSARRTDTGANRHRAVAIASMSVATLSTLMMYLWKN
jgi:hypothetical protein